MILQKATRKKVKIKMSIASPTGFGKTYSSLLLAYGITSFQAMIVHNNPLITIADIQNYYDSSMKLNFKDIGFKVAFFVQGYMDNEPKDDPNYIQWVIQLNSCDACDSPTPINLTYHKCTDEDYDSFYPPEPSYVA